MFEMMKIQKKHNEKGNVLFLILIAVALFAALSYAVTSSSRSGGGNANDETSLVKSAQITQYPSSVRTSIIRMMVSKGIDATELEFNAPSAFSDCTGASDPTPSYTYCVFHPQGGGASMATMSTDVMAGSAAGQWYFSANYEIQDIGTSEATDPAGNDIIAFLPGISNGVCARINEELGITGDTTSAANWDVTPDAQQMTDGYTIPNETDIIGDAGDTPGLAGQAFGCLTDTNENIYYHVLIER